MLEAANLDDARIAAKLNELLEAKKVVHYQGEEVGVYEDGQVQSRALELLAEIRGHKKAHIELSGELGVKGYVGISPDDWDDNEASDIDGPDGGDSPDAA